MLRDIVGYLVRSREVLTVQRTPRETIEGKLSLFCESRGEAGVEIEDTQSWAHSLIRMYCLLIISYMFLFVWMKKTH